MLQMLRGEMMSQSLDTAQPTIYAYNENPKCVGVEVVRRWRYATLFKPAMGLRPAFLVDTSHTSCLVHHVHLCFLTLRWKLSIWIYANLEVTEHTFFGRFEIVLEGFVSWLKDFSEEVAHPMTSSDRMESCQRLMLLWVPKEGLTKNLTLTPLHALKFNKNPESRLPSYLWDHLLSKMFPTIIFWGGLWPMSISRVYMDWVFQWLLEFRHYHQVTISSLGWWGFYSNYILVRTC